MEKRLQNIGEKTDFWISRDLGGVYKTQNIFLDQKKKN